MLQMIAKIVPQSNLQVHKKETEFFSEQGSGGLPRAMQFFGC